MILSLHKRFGARMRSLLLPFALLGALALPPGPASAQAPAMSPVQRCEQNGQACVRACVGAGAQNCMAGCAASRAHCVQNPSTAGQPRR